MSQSRNKKTKSKEKLICYCNGVSVKTVEEAIERGAKTMGEIFDRTTAGCGPCGGSCQPEIRKLLTKKLNEMKNDSD